MEPRLLAQENSGILRYSCVLLWSVRNAARFDGKTSNLRRIARRKCALQFLIQLKVEFSLFPLCESFSCGHYELSIHCHVCGAALLCLGWAPYSFNARREAFFRNPTRPRENWTEIMKSHPSGLSEKGFKLFNLFTVQQQQVHELRIQF
jgi:hypothetical protein